MTEKKSFEMRSPEGHFIPLYAGSRIEGLVMEPRLGYDMPDLDVMFVYKGSWVVRLPNCANWKYMSWQAPAGCTDGQFSHLQVCEDECPAGYCKVKVNGSPKELIGRLAKAKNQHETNVPSATLGTDRATNCFVESEGTVWLSSSKIVKTFSQFLSVIKGDISGPACLFDNGQIEIIVALMCAGPLPAIRDFQSRPRQSWWPHRGLMDRMQKAPGMLVCASHKSSDDDQQALHFRASFSLQELMLARDMPMWVKQGYTAFKLTVKSLLARHRHSLASAGRSKVCSYHLKTVLFWTLEDPDIWNVYCPFQFMMRLLTSLRLFITKSPPVLPNYFIPECNLFAHIDRLDIELLLLVIKQIQTDPFKCILDAPSSPGLLYGVGTVVGELEDYRKLVSSLRELEKEDVGASKDRLQQCVHMLEKSNPHRHPFRWLLAGCLLSRVERYRNHIYSRVEYNPRWFCQEYNSLVLTDEKNKSAHRRRRPSRLMSIWHRIKEQLSR